MSLRKIAGNITNIVVVGRRVSSKKRVIIVVRLKVGWFVGWLVGYAGLPFLPLPCLALNGWLVYILWSFSRPYLSILPFFFFVVCPSHIQQSPFHSLLPLFLSFVLILLELNHLKCANFNTCNKIHITHSFISLIYIWMLPLFNVCMFCYYRNVKLQFVKYINTIIPYTT